MHEERHAFACAAIGGCVIVAGGDGLITAEVYEEALGRQPSPRRRRRMLDGERGDVISRNTIHTTPRE
jgi:hypothetical protein